MCVSCLRLLPFALFQILALLFSFACHFLPVAHCFMRLNKKVRVQSLYSTWTFFLPALFTKTKGGFEAFSLPLLLSFLPSSYSSQLNRIPSRSSPFFMAAIFLRRIELDYVMLFSCPQSLADVMPFTSHWLVFACESQESKE